MPSKHLYSLTLAGFIAAFGLCLLALVDFRRGFLFTEYSRSPYSAFHPAQLLLLGIGAAAMVTCASLLKKLEGRRPISRSYLAAFTFGCLALLVADLFIYRGVPASRAIAAGRLGVDWLQAYGVTGWLRPVALSVSYLFTVWHATMLGILIAGLALTALPLYFKSLFSQTGMMGTVAGALYSIPQPFCSCCAAVMLPSYARRGASTEFALSFVVGSPMLNITTIILAFNLLPLRFAIMRAVAGVLLAVVATYGVTRLTERWRKKDPKAPLQPPKRLSVWAHRYSRLFDIDRVMANSPVETPSAVATAWLRASTRVAVVLVPTLFIWSVVTAAVVQLLPASFGNNFAGVVLAAVTGTVLMITSWTEIPVALQLIESGMTGPAATLLVVLPPVSLPCLMLLAGALGRFRSVVLLALVVMLSGILAGVAFL